MIIMMPILLVNYGVHGGYHHDATNVWKSGGFHHDARIVSKSGGYHHDAINWGLNLVSQMCNNSDPPLGNEMRKSSTPYWSAHWYMWFRLPDWYSLIGMPYSSLRNTISKSCITASKHQVLKILIVFLVKLQDLYLLAASLVVLITVNN